MLLGVLVSAVGVSLLHAAELDYNPDAIQVWRVLSAREIVLHWRTFVHRLSVILKIIDYSLEQQKSDNITQPFQAHAMPSHHHM